MAYTKPAATSGPSSEVMKLQSEITDEVNGDAQHLATAVFGKPGNMPDMQRVSDEELQARYRAAYTNNDRQYLTQEAQRDPEQFITVARKIGVMLPEEIGQDLATALPPPVAPSMPSAAPPLPPPPVAAPAPVAPPGPMPATVPPPLGVNLGAVAQPGQPVPYTVPPNI
jgi:hypothetical protein